MWTTVGGQAAVWTVVENLEVAGSEPSRRTEAHRLSEPVIEAGKATVLKRAFSLVYNRDGSAGRQSERSIRPRWHNPYLAELVQDPRVD